MLTRLISGTLVATAIVLSVLFLKPVWLLMVAAISVAGTWELAQMLSNKGHRVSFRWPAALNVILLVGVYWLVESDISPLKEEWDVAHAQVRAWITLFMVFASTALMVRSVFRRPRAGIVELFAPLFQLAYLGWFPCYFILLRSIPYGEFFLVWALTSVAFSDIGAYFAGRYLGKSPYFQHLSPNKTREGAIGGIAASVAIAAILALAFGRWLPIPFHHVLILATGMACLGQMGDLIESMIKRDLDVKDSGNLIPGHGGVLDRVDSYLLLAPFVYYYFTHFVLKTF